MGAQNGKDLLVKVDLTGDGQFETMAGLRATRVSFNAESVDVTTLESQGGWRELLAGAGVKSANISGSGVFKDQATDERARQIRFMEHRGFQHDHIRYALEHAVGGLAPKRQSRKDEMTALNNEVHAYLEKN